MSLSEIARKEVGYIEEGGNNNNKYAKYFNKGGNFKPFDININNVSWCAIFVSYCLELDKNPLFYHLKDKNGNLRAGAFQKCCTYCPTIEQHFKENKKLFDGVNSKMKPQKDDIVLFTWNKPDTADHIGIVLDYDKNTGFLTTIEGNTSSTSAGSQDNGDGVFIKKRHISLTSGFIRPK